MVRDFGTEVFSQLRFQRVRLLTSVSPCSPQGPARKQNGRTVIGSPVWSSTVLCRSFSCFEVMCRGVLDGKRLYARISLHQWYQAAGDFLEQPVVIVFDVRRRFPQCHAAELTRGWVQRLDVIDESRLRLDARQKLVVQCVLEVI